MVPCATKNLIVGNLIMFIRQAFKVQHDFWRYLVGSLLVFIAAFIGQLPLAGALILETIQSGEGLYVTESNMYDLLEPNLFLFLMLI